VLETFLSANFKDAYQGRCLLARCDIVKRAAPCLWLSRAVAGWRRGG
jgi:hypothetical protein